MSELRFFTIKSGKTTESHQNSYKLEKEFQQTMSLIQKASGGQS